MSIRLTALLPAILFATIVFIESLHAGKAVSPEAPPPGTSTLIYRLSLPPDVEPVSGSNSAYWILRAISREGYPFNAGGPATTWEFKRTRDRRDRKTNNILWAVTYVRPGHYLFTDFTYGYGNPAFGTRTTRTEIRCMLNLTQTDAAVFLGTITVNFDSRSTCSSGPVDGDVKAFYDEFVPFKRSSLAMGELVPELTTRRDTTDPLSSVKITPLSPKPGRSIRWFAPQKVDSLRPGFSWEVSPPMHKVDLVVWEAIRPAPRTTPSALDYAKGFPVYYQEGITGNHAELDKDLLPDSTYFWSLRPTGSADWLTLSHSLDTFVFGNYHAEGIGFYFITPK